MDLEIKVTKFEADINQVVREDNIKAFVTWKFETGSGVIKIYGGTIRLKPFGEKQKMLMSYDPPAIRMKGGYNKVLFIDNAELYKKLCKHTIDTYYQVTGEARPEVVTNEEVNSDDLPF